MIEPNNCTSLWSREVNKPSRFPVLTSNVDTDVCIVGSGIAGLSTANFLAEKGVNVTVVDKDEIGGIQTFRSTAHLSNVLDHRYSEIIKTHGLEKTKIIASSHTAAIEKINNLVRSEGFDCDLKEVNGYLFLGKNDTRNTLENEKNAVHKLGIAPLELLEGFGNAHFDLGPCLHFSNQAQINPGKYVLSLAQRLERLGGKIYQNTRAIKTIGGKGAHLISDSGNKIFCRHLVLATNSPISSASDIIMKEAAYRTYAIACSIPKDVFPTVLLWDTATPFHYIRQHDSEEFGPLLIIGGEDHRTGQEKANIDPYKNLETWGREHFSFLGETKFKWSGQIIESMDHAAYIGSLGGDLSNMYIATGDCGNGMTYGTIAGMLITDLIFNRKNPWEEVYDPQRIKLFASGTFLKENLNTALQYSRWMRSDSQLDDYEDLATESGVVINKGLHKVAVYKNKFHQIIEKSAVCTHMKGIVHWNNIEKTWDCPCHGSRFDCEGKVIDGPAVMDLEDYRDNMEEEAV